MAVDNLLDITGGFVTKTATFTSNPVALSTGRTPLRKPLWIRIRYKSASNASGSNTVQFSAQDQDVTNTYYDKEFSPVITLTTTAQSGEYFIPLVGFGRYSAGNIQFKCTIAGAGSTPTVTFAAEIVNATG